MTLSVPECRHFWLEMKTTHGKVIAICKHYACRRRAEFTLEEWTRQAEAGQALNKPIRV